MKRDWPERRHRHAVELDARVVRNGKPVCQTKVVDLSLDGCKLAGEFQIGERIELSIGRLGMFLAVIRWSMQNHSGARFVRNSGGSDLTC